MAGCATIAYETDNPGPRHSDDPPRSGPVKFGVNICRMLLERKKERKGAVLSCKKKEKILKDDGGVAHGPTILLIP